MKSAMLTQNHEEGIPMEGVKRVVRFTSLMSFIIGFFTVLIIQEINLSVTNWLVNSIFENNTKIEKLAPSIRVASEEQHGGTIGYEPTNVLTLARKYVESEIQLAELTNER